MLVVADQPAVGIARQRRLAGARQPEKEGDVAVLPGVRRAVHRQDVFERQDVIQHRENRLLHLARVARPADQHQLLPEVHGDHNFRVGAVALRVGLEARCIDDGELRRRGLCRRRLVDEQVAAEQVVPRELVDNPHTEPILRVSSREAVQDEQLFALQRSHHITVQQIELGRLHRSIDRAPGNHRLARRLAYEELVVGRAAGMLAGQARQRTVGGDQPFLAAHRFLEQRGRGQVPLHAIGKNALALEPSSPVNLDTHQTLPKI